MPGNAHVTVQAVSARNGQVQQTTKFRLTLAKPGHPAIDQTFTFAPGETNASIAQAIGQFLSTNGYTASVPPAANDFKVVGGTIYFYGISRVDGGRNNSQVKYHWHVDSGNVNVGTAPVGWTRFKVTPRGQGAGGQFMVAAQGITWNPENTEFETGAAVADYIFTSEQTAEDIMNGIRAELDGLGWAVSLDQDGYLVLNGIPDFDGVLTLELDILYPEAEGEDPHDDHWVLML